MGWSLRARLPEIARPAVPAWPTGLLASESERVDSKVALGNKVSFWSSPKWINEATRESALSSAELQIGAPGAT